MPQDSFAIFQTGLIIVQVKNSISFNWNTSELICHLGAGTYTVSNIDATKCTHLVYAFAVLDASTFNIKVFDPWIDTNPTNVNGQMYSKFVALKKQNPSLKTMIAIGGWADSNDGTAKYSKLVSSTTNINTFVSSVVSFLKLYTLSLLGYTNGLLSQY